MTTIGTSYFPSRRMAVRYYRPYHFDNVEEAVDRKIREGEIHIGKPPLKPGQALCRIDGRTRYAIVEPA